MSSVMRPYGPLPPRVYWTRRLLALVVLLVVISILWWCVQKVTGNADGSPAGVDDQRTQQTELSNDPATTPTPDESTAPVEVEKKKPRKHKKKNAPLLAPTGGC